MLYYAWTFNPAITGNLAVKVTDDGGQFEVSLTTSAYYNHRDLSSIVTGVSDFGTALKTALDSGTSSASTYTVTFNPSFGYAIAYTGTVLKLEFSLATDAAAGTLLKQVLGFQADQTGTNAYVSDARPLYMLIPSIDGRSNVSDEYEPDDIVEEAVNDGGEAFMVARDTTEVFLDWEQPAETQTAPSSPFNPGVVPFERFTTAAVPWTYQHAFRHNRKGRLPFIVVDGTEQIICSMRAKGASFKPKRFARSDYPLWTIPFQTRLLGRL